MRPDKFTKNYGSIDIERAENVILEYIEDRPITIILPSTYKHAMSDSMEHIIHTLSQPRTKRLYSRVIIGLDEAFSKYKFNNIMRKTETLENRILSWNNAPEMISLYEKMGSDDFRIKPGKGRNAWTCMGLNSQLDILEGGNKHSIILHDCDIRPEIYNEDMIISLMLPLVNPRMKADFVKAGYERITTDKKTNKRKFAGRVTRLVLAPLIEAIEMTYGDIKNIGEFMNYLRSFEYALSGEIGMKYSLAEIMPIQADWGLEMGTLSYLFDRDLKIGQVIIGKNGVYDHEHAEVSHKDPSKGLNKMAIEVTKTILRKLYSIAGAVILDEKRLRKLMVYYVSMGNNLIDDYYEISRAQGLYYPKVEEIEMLDTFENSVYIGIGTLIKNPMGVRPLTAWNDMDPKLKKQLGEIVLTYNKNNRIIK